MNYADTQLKQALAKMLPEHIAMRNSYITTQNVRITSYDYTLCWNEEHKGYPVLDTELLHLCWLAEETLCDSKDADYAVYLFEDVCQHQIIRPNCYDLAHVSHATWQQRVFALAKVKGVEII